MIQAMLSGHMGSSGGRQEQGGPSRSGNGRQDYGGHSGHTHHNFSSRENTNQDGSRFGDGFKPKMVKLNFSRFDGEDLETWCCRAEQFFYHYGTLDTQRLNISSFRKEGRAMVWF
jgi:hypothetical protein